MMLPHSRNSADGLRRLFAGTWHHVSGVQDKTLRSMLPPNHLSLNYQGLPHPLRA